MALESKQRYQIQERGNRAAPKRSDRTYHSLRILHDKLKLVADSEFLPAGEALLDFGCADKPYEQLFKGKFSRYVGADLAGNAKADLIIDATGNIPCPAEDFDCVLSSQVLEHVADPPKYLDEAWRVLRPGASLILSTHGIWPYHPDPNDYWRWTIEGLQREISNAGFDVLTVLGVFGPESSALQLWQDATSERLPKMFRSTYVWGIQAAIGFIERRRSDKCSNDASIYVVVARKRT